MMRRCWIVGLTLAAALMAGPAVADGQRSDPNVVKWYKGTMEYRSLATKEPNGSEEFRLSVHPDGRRTIQTTNRLQKYGARRDITMRVDSDFKPEEVFASYWVQGEWRGSGLFTLKGQSMKAFVNTENGLIEQTLNVPQSFSFVPHPLSTNAFHHWVYDHEVGGVQPITLYDMPPRALPSASLIGRMMESTIEYVGRRDIETPAGRFETDFYLYGGKDFEMYVTPEDSLIIKAVWPPTDAEYVLMTLEEGP